MDQTVVSEIQAIVGEANFSTNIADLYTYGFDASIHHVTPSVVVRPSSTEEVSAIMKMANKYKIPVVPRGAGTGLCGGAVPLKGGIVMDLTRMNKIKELRIPDLYCVCEAGVVYDALQKALAPYKFTFPPTPGSAEACTIGGMVATNASGMRAVKYGGTRDYVLGLEVVLPTGEIMRVGTRTLKDASGYQLERFFVGSEGTLGVITEVTLKVVPKPKKMAMVLAGFDSLEKAGQCVSNLIAKPLLPSAMELMDSTCIRAVNKAINAGLPDVAALCMIEVDGEPEIVAKELVEVAEVANALGAVGLDQSDDPKQMAQWTNSRKSVMSALSRYGKGLVSVSLADDMAVPISKIPDAVMAFAEIAERNHVIVGTYGHAADGNLHTKMLLNPESQEAWKNGENAVREIFDTCVKLGGTVTGEHGVGISKAPYFQKERASALGAMKVIKKALDPNNIMNPGKQQEWEEGCIIKYLRYPCQDL
ncbi:FAD-binding oxidoreductase [Candidatus Methanomassiliicoccus intestinalis]|uniref:FAD-binding oxidoreductase n=1 Tax=Candidatus Methanomassiliicoccus intestinalis TaxID=1406512 RepID=UPI0037DDBE99